jgi:hypothetical protein
MAKKPARQSKAAAKNNDIVEEAKVIAEDEVEQAEVVEEPAKAEAITDESPAQDGMPADDAETDLPRDEEPAEPEVQVEEPAADTEKRRSGFLPLLLGGAAAAALGFGVASYTNLSGAQQSQDMAQMIADQGAQIAELETQIAAVPPPVDLAGLEAAIGLTQTDLSQGIEELEFSLGALDARLSEVEKRSSADGTLSDTALAAYDRELEAMRAEMAAQQESVRAMAEEAVSQLAATQSETQAIELDAVAIAQAVTARAALGRIQVALDTGEAFEDALTDLQSVTEMDIPQAVLAAARGVSTLTALRDEFPAAARAALSTARDEGVAGETGGFGAFLRDQLDVRSVVPREGGDPDAILSRAEAALRSGRLSDTLAEIETLPEVSRAALTYWVGQAQARADAIAGVQSLSQTLNQN